MPPLRTFKKYANRKIYDSDRAVYVSMRELSSIVAGGVQVVVVDDRTGRDITFVTLARALYERVSFYINSQIEQEEVKRKVRKKATEEPLSPLHEPFRRAALSKLIAMVPEKR